MKNIFHTFRKLSWLIFPAAIALGLVLPQFGKELSWLLEAVMIIMLLLSFLKLEIRDVLKNIRDWKLMTALTVFFLLLVPAAIYLIVSPFDQTLAIAFLLLAAVAPGIATPAITDMMKGNTALSMSIMIICSFLSPFTIPLLFATLTPAELSIDAGALFLKLVILIFIPFLLSYPVKKMFPKKMSAAVPYFSGVNMALIAFIVYVAIAMQQTFIMSHLQDSLWQLVLLYLFFIALHGTGYLAGYGRNKEDKITLTVSNTYRNNGLAIVIAVAFFSPQVILPVVLSEIPWCTLIAPCKRILKRSNTSSKILPKTVARRAKRESTKTPQTEPCKPIHIP